jgi:peptide chain release factor subunit 1
MRRQLPSLQKDFRRASLSKRDFGYHPATGDRRDPSIQPRGGAVLAKSRNHLLFHALDDEDWVLWVDVDLAECPPGIIETLLATGKDIVQPHCVLDHDGPTFDQNAWTGHGAHHLDAYRGTPIVKLDAVGGTMLLVRADIHREGLVFPAFRYGLANPLARDGGEVETEGLGMMARDMGYECWGLPDVEIRHRRT